MDAFNQQLQEWQIFYATVATACATLMGLLFVSLSVNVDRMGRQENAELMRIARRTFADFLYVLMLSLLFLVPHQTPIGFAVAVAVLGGSRLIAVAGVFYKAHRQNPNLPDPRQNLLHELVLPVLASAGLFTLAFVSALGYYEGLSYLVAVITILIASGSQSAWFLLVRVRDPSKTSA